MPADTDTSGLGVHGFRLSRPTRTWMMRTVPAAVEPVAVAVVDDGYDVP